MIQSQEHYYREGATWEYETYLRLKLSNNRAWLVAGVASAVSVLSLLALVLVLPLKEFAPYVVTVHEGTGYLEVTRGLKPGDLSEDEAVTSANIVRCLTAHETFDATDVKENFAQVNLCMADQALDNYRAIFAKGHPDNPVERYGYESTVRVQIKSLQLLTESTAQVRFQTVTTTRDRNVIEHWVAVLTFRYVQKPASLADRFKNPLGFQITRFRRDQEILPNQ
ncbi:MAG: type VI secretion protein [Gammaproteobacteria bacterium]|nr:MAG: type VI secretion protein [Gammaproteobacteria bacterium]